MTTPMAMATIRPADELGAVLAGRSQAARLRSRLEKMALHESVTIDFAGVLAVSPSFADELFGKMDSGLLDDGSVVFVNVSGSLAAIARYVRTGRPGGLPA